MSPAHPCLAEPHVLGQVIRPGAGCCWWQWGGGGSGEVAAAPCPWCSSSLPTAANQLLPAPALRPAPRAWRVGVLMRREPDSLRLALNCCCLLALNEALLQKRQQPRLLSPCQPPPSSQVPA